MGVFSWLNPKIQRPDLAVVMYSRKGCCLCDDAWRDLEALQKRHGFQLSAIDVDADEKLRERFTTCVPVIEVGGKVRQRGRFNAVLFERELAVQ